MIPEQYYPIIRQLWASFKAASIYSDSKLLIALGWDRSGLNAALTSPSGGIGLMQMAPKTAVDVAQALNVTTYDLTDADTSIRFAAYYLGQQMKRFGIPRLAVAAYVAGPGAVQAAGGTGPADADSQRAVRNVTAVWAWLRDNLDDILQRPADASAGAPAHPAPTTTASSGPTTVVGSSDTQTQTTQTGTPTIVTPPAWRLIAPAEDWQHPLTIDAAQLSLLEQVASRLGLAYTRDDTQHKVYLGSTRITSPSTPLPKGRLIVPVPGATEANNGAYAADTGLDVLTPFGSAVVAAGAGTIVYSEHGHTPWTTPPDTPNSILIQLDTPFTYQGRSYPFTWYTHLSRLRYQVPDGQGGQHVAQGETIAWSGIGNRVPHLHFGVVFDRPQTIYVPPLALAAYFGWAR